MFELRENKSIFHIDKVKIDASISKELDLDNRLRLVEVGLRRQYAKESFQSSRQIEGALAKIGIKKIWSKLSPVIGQAPDDIKIRLDLLVRRRNQIVHEGDLNHLHNLQVIERNDLDESLRFTKELMSGIIYEYTKLIV